MSFRFNKNKSKVSGRGYEMRIPNNAAAGVYNWVFDNAHFSGRQDRTITFIKNFPFSWSAPQQLLAPIIAEYMYEQYINNEHDHSFFTLKDIIRFNANRLYIPAYADIDSSKMSLDSLSWSKYVRDYVPASLVIEADLTYMNLKNAGFNSPEVKDIQEAINENSPEEKYTDNEVAQALYHSGHKIRVSVSDAVKEMNKTAIKNHEYPAASEHFINVKYYLG